MTASRRLRVALAIVVVGAAGLLASCSAGFSVNRAAASPAATAPSPTTTPTNDPMMTPASVDLECGQLDALDGILFRTEWLYDHGKITDAAYQARLSAVQEGWAYMLLDETPVSSSIEAVQKAAEKGVSAKDKAYQDAFLAASDTCTNAGALVGTMALPEMGG